MYYYYMTMHNYLTKKEAEKYRDDILWFSLRYLHIEKEVYEIYKSHRRMSKFLHYFDIFHVFTDEFTKYWLDYFGEIASKKEMFSEIVKTVNLFQVISYALIILFLAIAFGCILIVFSLFIQERKEELKVIYLVGGSKSLIKKLVAIRVFKGSLAGSFLGILFGVLLTFPFRIALSDYFGFSLTLSHSFSFFLILLTAFFIPIFAAEFAVWIHFRRLVKQFNWG